ncbi:MAG: hypothetical protein LLF75_12415 [Eubacteriales bacterium]|nr:hypothetical protein [Eubacteriales bacterium]
MIYGFIDSATIYDIISITRKNNPKENCIWSWQSALMATVAVINMPNLKLAPAPGQAGAASGIYDYLMRGLSDIVGILKPDETCGVVALEQTRQLDAEYIQKAYQEVLRNESYQQWIHDGMAYSWTEHSTRLRGLFNLEFIPQISAVVGLPEKDLTEVWKRSCDVNYLRVILQRSTNAEDVELMKSAYMISALIRGYYHDIYAQNANLQIIHHPLRKAILPELDSQKIAFTASNTEKFFSTIILAGAISQIDQKSRINTWLDSVRKARKGLFSEYIDLRNKDSDSVALSLAIEAAQKLDICTSAKWIDYVIEIFISLGVTVASSFVFQGWESFILSASYGAMDKAELGKKINTKIANRDMRLKMLANINAGRIEQVC